jgi:hypothetical protein
MLWSRIGVMWVLLSSMLYALCGSAGAFRMTDEMSFAQLVSNSDLVVIADARVTTVTENTDQFCTDSLEQLDTLLNVHAVLKGSHRGELHLVHFKIRDDIPGLMNGPKLLQLQYGHMNEEKASTRRESRAPKYLLFLKRRVDGRYESVTDQFDSFYSAFALAACDGEDIRHYVDPDDVFGE